MKGALGMIHHIVNDEGGNQSNGNVSPVLNGDSGIGLDNKHSACKAFKEFEVIIDSKRNLLKRMCMNYNVDCLTKIMNVIYCMTPMLMNNGFDYTKLYYHCGMHLL